MNEELKATTEKPTSVGFFAAPIPLAIFFIYCYIELTNILNISMNKYQTWYKQITERGQQRPRDPKHENHHIIPKSLGGSNKKENITNISVREHFICHWLLTKIHATGEAHWKMDNALRFMRAENKHQERYHTKITSRVYARLKEEYALLSSEKRKGKGNGMFGKKHTPEAIAKIKAGLIGRVQPEEEKQRQIEAQTGRIRDPFSDEWKEKMAEAKRGSNNHRFGIEVSEETKKKIGARIRGTKQSPETIAKKAEAIRGSKREKKQCPHCNNLIAVNGYARWHGNNCKQLKETK